MKITYCGDKGLKEYLPNWQFAMFRRWAKRSIQAEFPEAEVTVLDHAEATIVSVDEVASDLEREAAIHFCKRLQQRIPADFYS